MSTHHCFQSDEVNQIASFGFQSYSIGSRTVHLKWIKTNHTQIRLVRPSGTDSVYSYCSSHPGTYGINGTFYCTSSGIPSGYSVGDIHRISLYNANLGSSPATSVRPFGEVNVDNTFFMYCQRQPTTSIPYIVGSDQFQGNISAYRFQGQHALELTNLRWAVGGFGLYLDSPISSASQYNNLLTAENAWSGFKAIAPRAAIFYIGGSAVSENIVLFTVFADTQLYSGTSSTLSSRSGGVTPYELRSIIKDIFPTATSHGIILDGGSSTGIAYKNASGGLYAQMVGTYANTMIVTPM